MEEKEEEQEEGDEDDDRKMNELDTISRHDDYADDSAHKLANQYLNIGVVVVICASRDWYVLVGHFDIFRVSL